MVDPLRRGLDQTVCELFGDFGREKAGMGVSKLVELLVKRGNYVGMAMAQT